MTGFQTLHDLLPPALPGGEAEPRATLSFFEAPGSYRTIATDELRSAALRRLAGLREQGVTGGTELLIPVAEPQLFLETLWAAIFGGLLPMPLAPPTNDATCAKILDILRSRAEAGADVRIVLEEAGLERLQAAEGAPGEALLARRVSPAEGQAEAQPTPQEPGDIAFIQYSSGSTRAPKGIVVRHGQALANLAAIRGGADLGPADRTFSWMPLSHDMGLVGFHLAPLSAGASQTIMPTSAFARSPLVWLQDAAAQGSTILSSPNFGYRHALKAMDRRGVPDGLDLSAVRLVMNGAEPISVALAREFMERLAPAGLRATAMFPVYGLAEATLAVSFPKLGEEIHGRRLARASLGLGDRVEDAPTDAADMDAVTVCGCGEPLPGIEVRIAGPDGAPQDAGRVGRVWIRGESVTDGYHDDPTATAAALEGEGWLDTGDLGFMDGGTLHITGRAKDLVIVDGQNLYPHDIEDSLAGALGIDALRVAVSSVVRGVGAEELAVFVQHRGEDFAAFEPTVRDVREHLSRVFGVAAPLVVPVPQIPRTTSGKVQRQKLGSQLVAGDFAEALAVLFPEEVSPAAPAEAAPAAASDASPEALEAMMVGFCEQVLDGMRFGPTDNLFEQGMSSIDLAEIHGLIEARYPKGLDIRDFFDAPTIRGLAEVLAERVKSGAAAPAALSNG